MGGIGLLTLSAGTSSHGIERALRGDATDALAWGPDLFRMMLALHGALLLLCAGSRLWRPKCAEGIASVAVDSQATPPGPTSHFALRNPQFYWPAVLALCLLAFALRLWGLGTDLWTDEVFTLSDFIRPSWGVIISIFPSQNQNMLYSLLAKSAVSMGGENPAMVRLPAVLMGVLSIAALFVLGRKLIGPRRALAACLLMTLSYHHVWFSQNARGYTGVLLFATLATWLWLEAIQRRSWRLWLAYSITVTLGMWVHLTMGFVVAAHGLTYLAMLVGQKIGAPRRGGVVCNQADISDGTYRSLPLAASNRREHASSNLQSAICNLQSWWMPLAAWCLAASLTLQWVALSLPEFLRSALHEVSVPSEWTSVWWLVSETVRGLHLGALGWVSVPLLLAVPAAGWWSIARRNWAAGAVLVLPAVLITVYMVAKGHNLWPRFVFFCAGFAILCAVQGLAVIAEWIGRRWPWRGGPVVARWATVGALVLAVGASLAMLPANYRLPKQSYSSARDFAIQIAGGNGAIVAVGLAGEMFARYYAPAWPRVESAGQLANLLEQHREVYLVYTMPGHMRAYHPDIWQAVERDFVTQKVFPGTLGGGGVYVAKARHEQATIASKSDKETP